MDQFELSDDMLTGIKKIDDQHRKLLTWGNAMFHEDTEAAVKVAEMALKELDQYISYHFRLEESEMETYEYNMLEKHRKHHDRLTRGVASLVNRLNKEGTSRVLLIKLQDQFREWFLYHIKEWDQPFAAYLKSNDINPSFSKEDKYSEVDWTKFGWARPKLREK